MGALVTSPDPPAPDAHQPGADDVWFSQIVDGLVEGITVMNADGRFIFANPSARRILGIGLDVMNGESPVPDGWRQLTEDGAPWTAENHPAAMTLRTGKPRAGVIMRIEKPDGTRTWVSVDTRPLFRDGQTRPDAVVTSFSDVTGHRSTVEALSLQKTLLEAQIEAARDGILMVDADGRVLAFNQRCAQIWGLTRDDLGTSNVDLARRVLDRITNPDALLIEYANKHPTEGDFAVDIHHEDGSIYERYSVPVHREDGSLLGRVVFFHDVTSQRRAQQEILFQKMVLEAQAEADSDGIIMLSPEGGLLFVNRRFSEIWGLPRFAPGADLAEALGQAMSLVANPVEFGRMVAYFLQHPEERDRRLIPLKDGRILEHYTGPVYAEDGTLYGRVVFFQDVTEQRHAREALERLSHRDELILNSAADGIIGLDASGRIDFLNPSAARMIGFTRQELIGQFLRVVLHHTKPDGTTYSAEESSILGVLASGKPSSASGDLFRRKDGTTFPVEYVSAPITEGNEIVGAVVTFKDISERYRIEKLKDEFISVVSHELRTPLTSMRGSLGLLASGLMGPLPPKAQHMLDIAVSNTDRLVSLINDILDIQRIESGKVAMKKEDCDAADVMLQAAEVMQAMADKAGVTIQVAPLKARLFGDPNRIIQVMTNLLSNAIKFSSPGGQIWLDAECGDSQIAFRVKDEGRGIPVDKLNIIFGRFQQVDASDSRAKGGTGLGLAICRSIVNQHGGRIWAESGPEHGPGSTFTFTVPRTRAKPRTRAAGQRSA